MTWRHRLATRAETQADAVLIPSYAKDARLCAPFLGWSTETKQTDGIDMFATVLGRL